VFFFQKAHLENKEKKTHSKSKVHVAHALPPLNIQVPTQFDQPLRAFGKNAVALPLPRSPLLGDLDESSASTVAHERACILEHRVAYKTRGRRSFTKRAGAGKRCGAD
jgi:hypothetical protein